MSERPCAECGKVCKPCPDCDRCEKCCEEFNGFDAPSLAPAPAAPAPRAEELTRNRVLLNKLLMARREASNIASGQNKWRMRIPAQPDDSDLLICGAFDEAIAEIDRLTASLARANEEREKFKRELAEAVRALRGIDSEDDLVGLSLMWIGGPELHDAFLAWYKPEDWPLGRHRAASAFLSRQLATARAEERERICAAYVEGIRNGLDPDAAFDAALSPSPTPTEEPRT